MKLAIKWENPILCDVDIMEIQENDLDNFYANASDTDKTNLFYAFSDSPIQFGYWLYKRSGSLELPYSLLSFYSINPASFRYISETLYQIGNRLESTSPIYGRSCVYRKWELK